jgi:dihydrofolate reductase
MTRVITALAASIDGFITGPNRSSEQPLGEGGAVLFDWYHSGDVASRAYPSFSLFAKSAEVFDAIVERTGAVIAGRTTYDDVNGWDGAGPHPSAALLVLSHRPPPAAATAQQTFVDNFGEALRIARIAAGVKDISLMGSGPIAAALAAGVLDEVTIHQVPVVFGGGTALFAPSTPRTRFRLERVVTAPDVTHVTYVPEGSD